ncbi:MAG: hypothetical protein ACQEUT_16785 [Bacillota bacterium]
MKDMLLVIVGFIVAWTVWGIFTTDFSMPFLFSTILAMLIGFSIGKKEKEKKYTV